MDLADTLRAWIGESGGDISWQQMSIRAVLIFIFGLALVRMASKRVFGRWGAIDIILSVVIGSNLSRALTGAAPFVETLAATAVLVVLHAALAALAVHVPGLGPVLKGQPCRLVRDGEVDARMMRRHAVGHEDLEEALRQHSLREPGEAAEVWLERNGGVSVIKR